MKNNSLYENHPWKFFSLVLILSIPFYLFGSKKLPLPIKLPVSALMLVVPLIAAALLTYRYRGSIGVRDMFKRAFDYKKITHRIWYIPIFMLNPLIYLLAYIVMRFIKLPLPEPEIPILLIPVFVIIFFIAGIFEELGWMGYAIDPLQNRLGALKAALILGIVWQLWHLIPDLQLDYSPAWIFWHDLQGVALRILMVWVYNNTRKSVFSSIIIHAMDNLSWALFPNFGSGFNPFFTAIFACLAAAIVLIIWEPKTLARYRNAGNESGAISET